MRAATVHHSLTGQAKPLFRQPDLLIHSFLIASLQRPRALRLSEADGEGQLPLCMAQLECQIQLPRNRSIILLRRNDPLAFPAHIIYTHPRIRDWDVDFPGTARQGMFCVGAAAAGSPIP
jgi:hypothetical protein